MLYSKKEEYTFTMPHEYKYYLEFKTQLKESGVKFIETGGSSHQIITIQENGIFTKDGELVR